MADLKFYCLQEYKRYRRHHNIIFYSLTFNPMIKNYYSITKTVKNNDLKFSNSDVSRPKQNLRVGNFGQQVRVINEQSPTLSGGSLTTILAITNNDKSARKYAKPTTHILTHNRPDYKFQLYVLCIARLSEYLQHNTTMQNFTALN